MVGVKERAKKKKEIMKDLTEQKVGWEWYETLVMTTENEF